MALKYANSTKSNKIVIFKINYSENGDGEETRDSSDSKEEKIDKDTLNKLLKSAMKRKSLSEADDIDV